MGDAGVESEGDVGNSMGKELSRMYEQQSWKRLMTVFCAIVFGFLLGVHCAHVDVFKMKSPGMEQVVETTHGNVEKMGLEEINENRRVYDIDIGTHGAPMKSDAQTLITFDPGDRLLITENVERYPYGVADFDGNATFHINRDFTQCSSLNMRNEFYDKRVRDERIVMNCGKNQYVGSLSEKCMHPQKTEEIVVPVRRLSSLLNEKGVRRVNSLKIDAQGSDFAILKDTLENSPQVEFKHIVVECQDYNKTIPLYMTSNDCHDIINYVEQKFPQTVFKKATNQCMSCEFNVHMTNMFTTFW